MALHLVGETLDKARSHYMAETGKLVQLMRGIYVDADDDIDATVLKHAVRIAKYLYPRAYLSAASAALLGPTRDGRLFLSARRKQRTRIRALEIIQNEAPKHPSIGDAVVDDGMGEFRVSVSSIRQRFLEAFRLRSEHAASIDEGMRARIAARLVEEYGSAQAAADALWTLARANEWYREGELAERYFQHRLSTTPMKNEAALDLIVAWHGWRRIRMALAANRRRRPSAHSTDHSRQAAPLYRFSAPGGLARKSSQGQGRAHAAAVGQALHVEYHHCGA
jgi:serine/threonine-protein kinase HipA